MLLLLLSCDSAALQSRVAEADNTIITYFFETLVQTKSGIVFAKEPTSPPILYINFFLIPSYMREALDIMLEFPLNLLHWYIRLLNHVVSQQPAPDGLGSKMPDALPYRNNITLVIYGWAEPYLQSCGTQLWNHLLNFVVVVVKRSAS